MTSTLISHTRAAEHRMRWFIGFGSFASESRIEEIRALYRRAFEQSAVLRADRCCERVDFRRGAACIQAPAPLV